MRSLLGVPLVAEGQLLGVLHVGSLSPRTFTVDDAVVLELAAARAAPAIERAQLADALEREREAAVVLQRSLLPLRLPDFVEVEVAARYLAARDGVGGDWFDVIALPLGRIGIAIGDVVGHGVRAAATMSQVRTALHAYALEGHDPAAVLGLVDRLLQSARQDAMATASYGVFDPEDGSLILANAGHPPPLLLRSGGAIYLDVDVRPPLGARPFTVYTTRRFTIAPDECVLFYTDGLVEVRGESLEEGMGRLRDEAEAIGSSPEQLCTAVTRRLIPSGGAPDDVAVLALRNVPIPDELELHLPAEPDVLSTVRSALRRWLRSQGAGAEAIEALVLAAGEAAANAVEHAYGLRPQVFDVTARREGDDVVIGVRDRGRWREPRDAGAGGAWGSWSRRWTLSSTGAPRTAPRSSCAGGPEVWMADADVTYEDRGGALVVVIDGEVDMSNAADLRSAIEARMSDHAQDLVIDLSGLDYIDSAGIHILFAMRKRLTARGQRWMSSCPPGPPPSAALRYAGVLDELGVAE